MPKNTSLTEYEEAKVLAQYLELKGYLFSHIPQETFTRSWGTKMKNKLMGVHRGVPDYIICLRGKLVFIELKRTKGGHATSEQIVWIEKLSRVPNVYACVAFGADDAIKFIESIEKIK